MNLSDNHIKAKTTSRIIGVIIDLDQDLISVIRDLMIIRNSDETRIKTDSNQDQTIVDSTRNQSRLRSRDNYSNQRRYSQSPRKNQQRSGTPVGRRVGFSRQNLVVANSPCNLLISSNNVWNGSNSESIENSVDILIDSGAQHSFIRRDLADSLNATIVEKNVSMHLIGFGGNKFDVLTDSSRAHSAFWR